MGTTGEQLAANESAANEPAAKSGLGKSWRYRPYLMLGIGYYFAWMILVVINCRSLLFSDLHAYPEILVRTSLSATVSVGLVAVMFLIQKFDVLSSGKWVVAFAVGASAMGTTLLVFALNYVGTVALLLASTTLIGFGNAVLLLSWGYLFQRLSLTRLAGHIALSCLFASVVCAIAIHLPGFAHASLVAILPVASGMTLIFCTGEPTRPEKSRSVWQNGLTKILICCIVSGIFCGMLRMFPVFQDTAATRLHVAYAVMVGLFALNVILVATVGKSSPILYLYWFCVPMLIIGYGSLMVQNETFNTISIGFALSGNILLEGLILLVYPFVVIRTRISLINIFGWSAVAQHVGSFIGLLLGNWISTSAPAAEDNLAIFSLLAVIAYVFLFFFILKELDILNMTKRDDSERPVALSQSDKVRALAQAYGLSPRETEVLHLLASGRSLPRIEQELVVSHSTARTHVRHIYEKMGINNRQQLHDLMER